MNASALSSTKLWVLNAATVALVASTRPANAFRKVVCACFIVPLLTKKLVARDLSDAKCKVGAADHHLLKFDFRA